MKKNPLPVYLFCIITFENNRISCLLKYETGQAYYSEFSKQSQQFWPMESVLAALGWAQSGAGLLPLLVI